MYNLCKKDAWVLRVFFKCVVYLREIVHSYLKYTFQEVLAEWEVLKKTFQHVSFPNFSLPSAKEKRKLRGQKGLEDIHPCCEGWRLRDCNLSVSHWAVSSICCRLHFSSFSFPECWNKELRWQSFLWRFWFWIHTAITETRNEASKLGSHKL